MKKSERNKRVAASVLLLAACGMLYFTFGTEHAPAPSGRAPLTRQSVLETMDNPQPSASGAPARGRHGRGAAGSAAALDPELRLDLLAKVRSVKYEGTERNVFQFYTPPPPPPPKPVAPVVVKAEGPPPVQPLAPIPLKFYGFASKPGESPKRAFFAEGDDIFIAAEGDVMKRRYKVLHIGVNTVEMEDLETHSRQKLPLQES